MMVFRFLAVFSFLFGYYPVLCQTAAVRDSGEGGTAAANARAAFLQAIQTGKEIYNGPEHIPYQPAIEGFAYFGAKDWQTGSVQYDGIVYSNEQLLYDLITDKLIVKRPEGFPVELRSERTNWFTLSGHLFVYVAGRENGLKPGFYDQLAAGAITVFAKRQKQLEERAEDTRIRQSFAEQIAYYAVKDHQSYVVRNLNLLLELTGTRSREIQQHLRKKGLKYKRNREAALVAAAAYFNQLKP